MTRATWFGAVALREAALWGAALLSHLFVAAGIAHLMIGPRPVMPDAPVLLINNVEVSIAETESLVPTRPSTQDAAPAPLVPQPAPFLFAPDAPLALPTPPDIPAPKNHPDTFLPPPPPEVALREGELPEIAFPPAEPIPEETPAPSAGDTARVKDPPRLLTDLTHIPKFYPPRARRNGWEGTVVLDVLVAPDGTCAEASILSSSGHDVLDKAALRMIRSARFSHGPGRVRQPIDFSLTK